MSRSTQSVGIIRIASVCSSLFFINTGWGYAAIAESRPTLEVEFRFNLEKGLTPILEANFDFTSGAFESIDNGEVYIACVNSIIDDLRLNFVLNTNIAAHYISLDNLYVGVSDLGKTVIGAPGADRKNIPDVFGFSAHANLLFREIRNFDKTAVSENTRIYGFSYIDFEFLRKMPDVGNIQIIYFRSEESIFWSPAVFRYSLDPVEKEKFVIACKSP
jgi:hypothetical protein